MLIPGYAGLEFGVRRKPYRPNDFYLAVFVCLGTVKTSDEVCVACATILGVAVLRDLRARNGLLLDHTQRPFTLSTHRI